MIGSLFDTFVCVQEALSRQDGVYMQYAAMNLVRLGYQLRIGILSAACYGAPQVGISL